MAKTEIQNLNRASDNNWRLVFPKLPHLDTLPEKNALEINIFGTVLPGASFGVKDDHYLGWLHKSIVENLVFNNWTVSFYVDEELNNWEILLNWLKFINNNKDIVSGHKRTYMVDSSILVFNNFKNQVVKRIKLHNLFPFDLGDIEMTTREGTVYLECMCSFAYDYYETE